MIEGLIDWVFGKHWFRVKFIYRVNGALMFEQTCDMGLTKRKLMRDHRMLKRANGPVHKIKGVNKSILSNGQLSMEPLCYLGKWREQEKRT